MAKRLSRTLNGVYENGAIRFRSTTVKLGRKASRRARSGGRSGPGIGTGLAGAQSGDGR